MQSNSFTFSFPSRSGEKHETSIVEEVVNPNEAAMRELVLMMKSQQRITAVPYVKKDTGKPMLVVQSPLVSKFSVPLTPQLWPDFCKYLERGEAPAEDYADIETTIPFEGNTDELQEAILRQWIEDGTTVQFMPTFRDRGGKLRGMLARHYGKVSFEVTRNEDFDQFLIEHGYNV